MSFKQLKYKLLLNLKNIPGPSIGRRFVLFESDDHGSIRMPSNEAYAAMLQEGISIEKSRYHLYDTMEEMEDLSSLFEVLSSVKDSNGNNAVFSPFVNVANPDFEKIKQSGYQKYFYEPFTETLLRYGRGQKTFGVWKQGMENGIFIPEFHGREHICVPLWMEKLREGNGQLIKAFDYGFVSVSNLEGLASIAQEFRPSFYFNDIAQKTFLKHSITEGVALFKDIFGYLPSSFMPANSLFHPEFEQTVLNSGVNFLNVGHKNPQASNGGSIHYETFTFRQQVKKNRLNYYIRNCAFEPNDESYRSINGTLDQISAAFSWNKAAIISTHRVNFTGGLQKSNREKGLIELKYLLKEILKKWPNVEFISTRDYLTKYLLPTAKAN